MNQVNLIGRLTRDPDVRYNQNQMAVARFSIAINTGFGDNERTDYPSIVVFGKSAENCEKYLAKGRLVAVSGRLQTGSYTNKDGNTVYTTDVVANRVEFLEWGDRPSSPAKEEAVPSGFQELEEDLPF
ncbi:MAG: single-stranded DNA-binding protein [Clostridia bacterium]|nr:single-stranded DNA-binding protein [Clostridia bacterium]